MSSGWLGHTCDTVARNVHGGLQKKGMGEFVSRYDKRQRPGEECGKSGSLAMEK
jgi:hypothetical protein